MYSGKDLSNPIVISLHESGLSVDTLCIGEQQIDIGDTMSKYSILKRATALCVSEDLVHLGVRQYFGVIGFIVKYVVFHVGISSLILIFGSVLLFKNLSNKCIQHCLLLLIKGIQYIFNGFLVISMFNCIIII